MSRRIAAWLAWSAWALSLALLLGRVPLLVPVTSLQSPASAAPEPPLAAALAAEVARGLAMLAFATLGALVVTRRPGNRMGWLFLLIGLVNALEQFAGDYAVHALLVAPVPPPGGLAAAWLQSWLWIPGLALLFVFVPLLFPSGRPLSPRWGRVAWLAAGVVAAHSLVLALSPEPLTNRFIGLAEIANPLGVDSPIFFEVAPGGLFLDIALSLLLVGLVPVAIASSLLRLRRATADERQQMKWFVSAAAALAALFVLQAVARPVLGGSSPAFTVVASALLTATAIGTPVALGLAIFKHRLYDIDLLINRALVYGALSGALATVYFGSVVALQDAFRALTGQGSNLAVVASTLAIAALFQPLRRRLQAFIDRRFYRRKYDAQRTLAAFAARLRAEVDLETMRADLLAAVEETMQPAHVSLWLRPPDRTTSTAPMAPSRRNAPRNDLVTGGGENGP